jgi:Stage II sporulation protein E (SpoIIE)
MMLCRASQAARDIDHEGEPAVGLDHRRHGRETLQGSAFAADSTLEPSRQSRTLVVGPPQLDLDQTRVQQFEAVEEALDPSTGRLRYANAGHNPPYVHTRDGVAELRATGMPLGAMPDMTYEEKETTLGAGDTVLLHSDGLVEAHDRDRKMFGFPRLAELMTGCSGGPELIQLLLGELDEFTGPDWEQEDDITLVGGRGRG